jgi:hypothetical protein
MATAENTLDEVSFFFVDICDFVVIDSLDQFRSEEKEEIEKTN